MINPATLKRFIADMNSAVAAQINIEVTGDLLNLLVEELSIGVWRLHDEEYDYEVKLDQLKQLSRLKGVPHGYSFSTDSADDLPASIETIQLFIPKVV